MKFRKNLTFTILLALITLLPISIVNSEKLPAHGDKWDKFIGPDGQGQAPAQTQQGTSSSAGAPAPNGPKKDDEEKKKEDKTKISDKKREELKRKADEIKEKVKESGKRKETRPGYRVKRRGDDGNIYRNDDGRLPEGNYREYDVNPEGYVPEGGGWDMERFTIDFDTGDVYYSPDHFEETFIKLE
jgi:guanyl-specific ribonuclease Sa